MGSINIPFTSVQLSHRDITSLGPHAESLANNKDNVVVIIGQHDQNNALVTNFTIRFKFEKIFFISQLSYLIRFITITD